jgi:hypothetical protein
MKPINSQTVSRQPVLQIIKPGTEDKKEKKKTKKEKTRNQTIEREQIAMQQAQLHQRRRFPSPARPRSGRRWGGRTTKRKRERKKKEEETTRCNPIKGETKSAYMISPLWYKRSFSFFFAIFFFIFYATY